MRVASPAEITQFNEQGYIVVENIIHKEQLDAFQSTLNNLVDLFLKRLDIRNYDKATTLDEKIIALKNKDPNQVSIIQRIISRSPEFFSLTSCMPVMPFMRSLYSLDANSPAYIINNGIVFTCPHDKWNKAVSNFETKWHNDIFYTIPYSQFWQVWVPLLHDSTTEIGTLMVCPGSHKEGIGKQHINIHANYNNRYTVDSKTLERYKPESIAVKLGQIMIFDSRLIHQSGTNSSDKVRCSMLGAYHDATNEDFLPVGIEYKYYGKTPEQYFFEIFGDENAKKIMFDDSAHVDLALKNGV